ncbi:MAG: bifunctional lysylphosphatidylglycerol flippase/synthetase MprF [Nevskiaceae bacterium]|nr:MAG: bifunctional lysylphosphatidylglycerol flippase/synthetase MprF [Nevskiaceae bacterium]
MLALIQRYKAWLMPAITLLIFSLAMVVLYRSLSHLRWADVVDELRRMPRRDVLIAMFCAMGSYVMLMFYDGLALKIVGHKLPYWRIAETSFTAYAVGHSIGLSSISGGSVRLRQYSAAGLKPLEIAAVIALCSITFMLGVSTLLGLSLIMEAHDAHKILHIHPPVARALGILILVLVTIYLTATALRREPLTFKGQRFTLPALHYSLAQLLTSCIDLSFASAALYFLLPDNLVPNFPAFVGLYVLAIAAGVASNVPGGLGVFEGVLLLVLPDVPEDQLLGAVLIYRVLYYLVPFMFGIVLLLWGEWDTQKDKLAEPFRLARRWVGYVMPQTMSVLVFLAGAILLFSGSWPAIGKRMEWLADLLPLGVVEVSHLAGSAIGVGLMIVARGLYRRLDGAWWLTQMFIVAGIVAQLLKGVDYEEATLLAVVGFLLWLSRARFYRRAPLLAQRFSVWWFINVALVLAAAIWLGLVAYKNVAYANHLWWDFAFEADAPRMLRASLLAVFIASIFALLQLLGASRPRGDLPSAEDLRKAQVCLANSTETLANLAMLGDKQFLFSEQGDAFIMYQRSGRSWVALGDPVGNPERFESLAWRYVELCDKHGGRPVFYEVSSAQLPLYLDLGLSLVKLGEEARVPMAGFALEGPKRAELRQAKRKGEREGLSFRILAPEQVAGVIESLRAVSDDWLVAKTASEKGFSVGNFEPDYLCRFPVAVAEKNGEIVAFANLWRSAHEVSIDLMRYSGNAPKGVMDYLFVELMLWARDSGYQWFNLGMAPLSGLEKHALAPLWHKLGLLVHRYGEPFYNFDGLRRYKEKYDPVWRPRYLASPGGLALPRILLDTATLIAGGMREVIFK